MISPVLRFRVMRIALWAWWRIRIALGIRSACGFDSVEDMERASAGVSAALLRGMEEGEK